MVATTIDLGYSFEPNRPAEGTTVCLVHGLGVQRVLTSLILQQVMKVAEPAANAAAFQP